MPGFPFELQPSPDLASWVTARQITFTQDLTMVTEPAPAVGQVFYRFRAVEF